MDEFAPEQQRLRCLDADLLHVPKQRPSRILAVGGHGDDQVAGGTADDLPGGARWDRIEPMALERQPAHAELNAPCP